MFMTQDTRVESRIPGTTPANRLQIPHTALRWAGMWLPFQGGYIRLLAKGSVEVR